MPTFSVTFFVSFAPSVPRRPAINLEASPTNGNNVYGRDGIFHVVIATMRCASPNCVRKQQRIRAANAISTSDLFLFPFVERASNLDFPTLG